MFKSIPSIKDSNSFSFEISNSLVLLAALPRSFVLHTGNNVFVVVVVVVVVVVGAAATLEQFRERGTHYQDKGACRYVVVYTMSEPKEI